jgi:S1-C subfamily serine protease
MVAAGLAVAVAVAAGIVIGHAVWEPSTSTVSFPSIGNGSGNGSAGNGSGELPNGLGGGSTGNGFGNSNGSGSGNGTGSGSASSGIAAKVAAGLVDINTALGYQSAEAAGTGMVLTSDGEILTNNHVIEDATTISAVDIGNGHTYSATVVGYDPTGDIAVLQLQGASGLQTVSIGNSSSVKVGDAVTGIGNAGGVGGTPSTATGTVDALNQNITASDDFGGGSEQLTGLIKTDAPIQAGDSGGPLVNSAGSVIGIDTAASSNFSFNGSTTAGFAIPINTATALARQIENGQSSTTVHIGPTAFLGVEVSSGSSSSGNGLGNGLGGGTGSSGVTGADVVSVPSGTPANKAGIVAGDVITSVGGHAVGSPSDLSGLLLTDQPGDQIQVVWTTSSGVSQTATVQLATGPPL